MNRIILGPEYFPLTDKGKPVSSGSIYIGDPDTDPTVTANQKTVYALQEDGSTVALSQPVSTSAGGVPAYSGSPVTLMVEGDYSLTVLDSSDSQIFYVPNHRETQFYLDIELLSNYASLSAAVAAIGATETELWIDIDDTVQSNVTIPATLTIRAISPFVISDDSNNADLTINGNILANDYQQIFDWGNGTGTLSVAENTRMSIRWFGADGSASTDQTTAMSVAFTAMTNGCTLFFPAGTYTHEPTIGNGVAASGTGYLDLTSLTNIKLSGDNAIIKNYSSVVTGAWSGDTFYGIGLFSCADVLIENLIIDGNRDKTVVADGISYYYGIAVCGSDDVTIKHCTVRDIFGDCIAVRQGGPGIGTAAISERVNILDCVLEDPARNAIAAGYHYGLTISNNHIQAGTNTGDNTLLHTAIDIELEDLAEIPDVYCNTVISNNTFKDGTTCMSINAMSGVTISNNIIRDYTAMLSVNGATYARVKDVMVHGNTFTNSSGIGTALDVGDYVKSIVFDNNETIAINYGVDIASQTDGNDSEFIISNNLFYGESTAGLIHRGGLANISGNTFFNMASGTSGYMMLLESEAVVLNNVFYRNGDQTTPKWGIVCATNSAVIDNNHFRGAAPSSGYIAVGDNGVRKTPKIRYNTDISRAPLTNIVDTFIINSEPIDLSSATTQFMVYLSNQTKLTAIAQLSVTNITAATLQIGYYGDTDFNITSRSSGANNQGDVVGFSITGDDAIDNELVCEVTGAGTGTVVYRITYTYDDDAYSVEAADL